MFRLLLMFLVLLPSLVAAQSAYPVNEQPMYGGRPKTDAMISADEAFIRSVEAAMTRAEGAERASATGFRAFFQGDVNGAIRRFNQAWLLDPENASAFHGFALVLLERDRDPAGGEAMFKRALALPTVQAGTFTDYGRFLLMSSRPAEATSVLEAGLAKPNPPPETTALLAAAYFESGNVQNGCASLAKALPAAPEGLRQHLQQLSQRNRCK